MAGATILGISPGTRYVGIALFHNRFLADWSIKTYRGKWSDDKLAIILQDIEELIIRQVVSHIACKIPAMTTDTKAVKSILEGVKSLAKVYGIRFEASSMRSIKEGLHENIHNKRELAEFVAADYPELAYTLSKEMKNRNPYHLRVFEAIAVGILELRSQGT